MHKITALGFFVISILIGSAFVVVGTDSAVDTLVWLGMIIIAFGTINLAMKITFIEDTKRIETINIPSKKRKKRRK